MFGFFGNREQCARVASLLWLTLIFAVPLSMSGLIYILLSSPSNASVRFAFLCVLNRLRMLIDRSGIPGI